MGGGNWGEDNPGTLAAGWPGAGDGRGRPVGRVCTPGTPGSQWMPPKQDGWSKKVCVVVCDMWYVCVCVGVWV